MVAAHAMSDTYKWPRHFLTELVDNVQEISSVVLPARCLKQLLARYRIKAMDLPTVIPQLIFIKYVTHPLMRTICNPNTPYRKSALPAPLIQFVPQWLIKLLLKISEPHPT